MREHIKSLGNVLIILLVGMCPMGLGVIYSALSSGREYEGIIMSLSQLAGAFLCLPVMKRQYNIGIKDCTSKPKSKTALLIVTTALLYEITALLTFYRSVLSESEGGGLSLIEIIECIAAVVIAPAAEEIIFRFSMLSLLLRNSRSLLQKAASILTISVMWTLVHLSDSLLRNVDIILVGIILGIIFLKYKNIFYCIFFHAAANLAVCIPDPFLIKNGYILYISLPLCLLCISVLIFPNKGMMSKLRQ